MTKDPRREAVRDIVLRLSWGAPRAYAGDWAGDQADRILTAIDAVAKPNDETTCQ